MKYWLTTALLLSALLTRAQLAVEKTWVENRINPQGVTAEAPRLTWALVSDSRGAAQSAYQVQVAGSPEALRQGKPLIWDSGKVESGESVHVAYAGPALESGHTYYWQVRAWDARGKRSAWGPAGSWQMGLLNPEAEFTAQWIGPGQEEDTISRPSPYFRREFRLDKPVQSATAYITSHGMYEARLNGQRVGDTYLNPGWTS
ncbi:MAG TPA: alpha-L-rhamnosidase N-terminal domain-containing protein, partial [Robiginitalea sp.]|nr:alpha-L-rhamnosidase N-terminal domain-containing protein [Robiginitalea sp.]